MASETHENPSNDRNDADTAAPKGGPRPAGPLSGKLGVFIFVVLFGTAGYLTWRTLFTAGPPKPDPPEEVYLCAETNKPFLHKPKMGESIPVMSPYTNRKTGYRPEQCYCEKSGKRREKPIYVILKEDLGQEGPTTCPSCGALVHRHNLEQLMPPVDAGEPKQGTTKPGA
ncbi:MAG: hypothetical protein ACE5E1_03270 [Phycisphaerae bacterium]